MRDDSVTNQNVLLEVASYPRPVYGHAKSGKILEYSILNLIVKK